MIYQESMSTMERLLSLSVRGELSRSEKIELCALYRSLGPKAVGLAARNNQVEALVLETLSRSLPPEYIEASWRDFLRDNESRVLLLQSAWKAVALRLDRLGCRHALVENAGVMYGTTMPLAAFCAGDFDILVEAKCWESVKQAFRTEGFRPADRRNRPTNRIEFYRNIEVVNRAQWLNAGWRAFDRMWIPIRYHSRESAWLSRTQPSRKDPTIKILRPEDSLAFVSMHSSLHSYVRAPGIRLHVDVDRLVRDNNIDWDLYLQEIFLMNIRTRAFVSLALASGLLGTKIPAEALSALYPGNNRWRRIFTLLNWESMFYTGRRKLTRLRAIKLDFLLDEYGAKSWLRNVLLPPAEWMSLHFGRGKGVGKFFTWLLHMRRILGLIFHWYPS